MAGDSKFDPNRSLAIREMLVDTAARASAARRPATPIRRRAGIVAISLGAVVILGVGAFALTSQLSGWPHVEAASGQAASGQISTWPRNANGQTYGVQGHSPFPPVLVRVTASNGLAGYVFSRQLNSSTDSPHPVELPVYDSDGTTKVGVLRVGGTSGEQGGNQ